MSTKTEFITDDQNIYNGAWRNVLKETATEFSTLVHGATRRL